jgi:AcrR family transcriptional regulator
VAKPGEEVTPSGNRHEVKRARRIEHLERTAAQIFAQNGYEGTNFELIAAELDLRGPSLYHYFSSKEELFLRCVHKSAAEVFNRLRAIVGTDLQPLDKLRALFREQALIEVRDYPEFVPLFFRIQVPVADLSEAVLQVRREHATIFEDVAKQIRAHTKAPKTDVRIQLGVAYGALAYLSEWYDPLGAINVEELADKLADLLVAPFLTAAGSKR